MTNNTGTGAKRGRPVGSSVKQGRASFNEAIAKTKLDPEDLICQFALDEVPCNRCDSNAQVSNAAYMALAESVWATDREKANADPKGMQDCPVCGGTKFKVLGQGEQLKALIRIMDSRQPKLQSLKVESDVGRVLVSRMNAVERKRQEELQAKMDEAKQSGEDLG